MNGLEIVSGVLMLLSCIAIVLLILFQEPKAGLGGAISGSDDNFYGGNRGKTNAGMLNKATKITAVVLFLITLIVNAITIWL